MCGRLRLTYKISELIEAMKDLKIADDIRYDPNAAPTDAALIIAHDPDRIPKARQAVFGLIPHWSKDPDIAARLCNARIETAHEKPSFRAAYAKRHCLVPCSGFYEWREEQGRKQPYHFSRRDGRVLMLAGLWERWMKYDEPVYSFTILTHPAADPVLQYHHRSPVFLKPHSYEKWLSPKNNLAQDMIEAGSEIDVKMAPPEMNTPSFKSF